jgi:two-component system catabolic regulation response regulator CreB
MIDHSGLKVVVGDSDRTVLELLQIRLDLAGFHTCVARSGPAVLDTLKRIRPAAMVLDLGLAEMNGFEVLQNLTRRGEKPSCPILVIGRKLAIEDIQRAIGLGARDCMVKPFSGADILERMDRLLRAPARPAPAFLRHV